MQSCCLSETRAHTHGTHTLIWKAKLEGEGRESGQLFPIVPNLRIIHTGTQACHLEHHCMLAVSLNILTSQLSSLSNSS